MQKYYIRDFLTKELEKNDGKLTQYYVENDHEAIIEREIWGAAQLKSTESKSLNGIIRSGNWEAAVWNLFMEKFFVGAVAEGW